MTNAEIIEHARSVAIDGDENAPGGPIRASRKGAPTRLVAGLVGVVAVLAIGASGLRYWNVGRFEQSTDDAYVKADSSTIAPKVSGYIARLLVNDNQQVRAGQPLALIDDRDLRTAVDEASAGVAAAQATVANLDAQIRAQDPLIRQADAGVAAARASLALSQRNDGRRQTMARVGYGTVEQADDAATQVQENSAGLAKQVAAAAGARQQIDILKTQRAIALAQVSRAQAALHQAQLNLGYATITAPIDGTVGVRTVRVGQYVQAGSQLMALVPLQSVYVVANFKETQLTQVQPGQPARISVDTFPDNDVVGKVDSLAPASGLEFALLPPDNATGNFTKIVQRIPVKVVFSGHDALPGRLRPGMSVTVAIDTRRARR